MKKYIIAAIFLYLLIPYKLKGQAFFHSINPVSTQTISQRALEQDNSSDTLELPFFDDFSYSQNVVSPALWLNQSVFVNNNFPINPPSVGVATFDMFNSEGQSYPYAQTSPFVADILLSKPLDLSQYLPEDSVYLSFYIQAKGLGWSIPNNKDSIVLEALNQEGEWVHLWSTSDAEEFLTFKNIWVNLSDTNFFYKGFQFRFYNYASISSSQNEEAINNDFWHLDYVYLDSHRSVTNRKNKDVAFSSFSNRIFTPYYSVPYSHYDASKMTIDTLKITFKNHYNQTLSVNNITYTLKNQNGVLYDSLSNASIDVGTSSPTTMSYLLNAPDNHLENYPSLLSDSTIFKSKLYFKAIPSDNLHFFEGNDTISFQQKFYNYYAYDDGSAESGFTLIGDQAQYAFKIEALKSDSLRGISIYFNPYRDFLNEDVPSFSLCVWEDNNGKPGSLIYKEELLLAQFQSGHYTFTNFKFSQAVKVDKNFFIGWENNSRKVYSLGYDMNNTNKNQVFYNINNQWKASHIGMPMLRPLMGEDFELSKIADQSALSQALNVKVYPNPTEHTLQVTSDTQNKVNLSLYSPSGTLLWYQNNAFLPYTIDLSQYPKGMYILKTSNKNQLITKKIIKR